MLQSIFLLEPLGKDSFLSCLEKQCFLGFSLTNSLAQSQTNPALWAGGCGREQGSPTFLSVGSRVPICKMMVGLDSIQLKHEAKDTSEVWGGDRAHNRREGFLEDVG